MGIWGISNSLTVWPWKTSPLPWLASHSLSTWLLFALLTTVPMRSLAGWELHCLHSVPDPADGGLWWTPPFICPSSISIWGTPFSPRGSLYMLSVSTSPLGLDFQVGSAVLCLVAQSCPSRLLFRNCHLKTGTFFSVHLAIKSVYLPVYFVHHLHGQAQHGSINSWS